MSCDTLDAFTPALLADALAGVHEAGYRHGDVKPSATILFAS